MGFPVCYTDLLLPNLFLRTFSLFALLRTAIHFLLRLPEADPDPDPLPDPYPTLLLEPEPCYSPAFPSLAMVRELLPVVRFSDLLADGGGPDPPEATCVVCLHDFEADDEIRRPLNCRHVFHRGCLDRWMGYVRKTCPLCRAPVVPDEAEGWIDERLWAASGVPEFYEDYHGDTGYSL